MRRGDAVATSDGFWRLQADDWSRNVRAQGKARKLRISDPVARRVFEAIPEGNQWAYQDPKGQRGLIRQGPGLAEALLGLVRSIDRNLGDSYDRNLGALAIDAFREWPKASGLSASMLSLEYVAAGKFFVGRIVSRAPYTTFIKSKPWRALLLDQGYSTTAKIATQALDEVKRG